MTRISIYGLLGALLVACSHATPIVDRYITYQVKSDIKPVGDVDGHVAGEFRNRGVCLKNVGLPDEEVGFLTSSGTFDAVFTSATTTGTCSMAGRTTCAFADSSSHTDEWTATCRYGPGGKLVSEGRSTYLEGRGRFEGIKGGGRFTGMELGGPEALWVSTPTSKDVAVPGR
jgi:hypothetical protein